MTPDQHTILSFLAERVASHASIERIAVFGSTARADLGPLSDVDVYIIWSNLDGSDGSLISDFVQVQTAWQDWAEELGRLVERPVSTHNSHPCDPPDDAWPAIERGLASPTAQIGKVILIPTPAK
ncbi:nucleotidyltransferase domain-containing protein [Methylobacterium nodulans]|uniref:Polymerase beta nucleotidyltransferase domain-containing protein n=1 Tax=Methylobacterium nodulans (strain LMG 21967 / CNCM I-2342 / ORS 2060) TaxID=460265 RepID=B8ICM9_METNO|nr:nucleotidyltransferase domain-containing protein [Methylobacterium nodulans]ACL57440.1 hypothetical protein Mnod_2470 [Methylobacterium nodulans ORS 2060]